MAYRFDYLAQVDRSEGRTDATGLNAFFGNELEQIRPQLYEKKYPQFKGRQLVPVTNDIHPGAMSITERGVDEVGEAEFITDLGDDAPMVEVVKDQEDTYYMRMLGLAYGWTLQELRNAQFAGRSLDTSKAFACRRGIERFIDKGLLLTQSVGGRTLYGLFGLSGGVAPLTYTYPLVGDVKDQSAEDLYRMLMNYTSYVPAQTKEIETVDTLVMAPTLKFHLQNTNMGDANRSSVLKYFFESQDSIKSVETSIYLENAGGHGGAGGTSRLAIYRKDKEVLEGLVNEFEQLPTEWKGMRSQTLCIARVGGVKVRLPKGIAYLDVPHA